MKKKNNIVGWEHIKEDNMNAPELFKIGSLVRLVGTYCNLSFVEPSRVCLLNTHTGYWDRIEIGTIGLIINKTSDFRCGPTSIQRYYRYVLIGSHIYKAEIGDLELVKKAL